MQRTLALLSKKTVRTRGDYLPYFRRVQEYYKKERHRQLPFLEVSKEPSMRPAIPDPRQKKLVKIDLAKIMSVRVGDRVRVLYGSEKGTEGVVGRIIRDKNQVIITGANMKRSFWHPEPGPGRPNILSVECPIHITNVVLLDPVTKQPTRIKRRYMMDGECVRVSKVSGCAMPDPVPVARSDREHLYRRYQEKYLMESKDRRGPIKENVFGNKDHFKTLVRIMRDQDRRAAAPSSVE